MKRIPILKTEDGSIVPSEEYPQDSVLVVAGDEFYTCYQVGDELPAEYQQGIK